MHSCIQILIIIMKWLLVPRKCSLYSVDLARYLLKFQKIFRRKCRWKIICKCFDVKIAIRFVKPVLHSKKGSSFHVLTFFHLWQNQFNNNHFTGVLSAPPQSAMASYLNSFRFHIPISGFKRWKKNWLNWIQRQIENDNANLVNIPFGCQR